MEINKKTERKILYLNIDEKMLTSVTIQLEKYFHRLGTFNIQKTGSIRDSEADLIIVGTFFSSEELKTWIKRLIKDLNERSIWIPVIFVADLDFEAIYSIVEECFNKTNWYFDLVLSSNMEELAMKIANLIKIHDHLKELKDYHDKLNQMNEEVEKLKQKLLEISNK